VNKVLPAWPGAMVHAGDSRIHVRRASSAAPDSERAVLVHGLGGASTNWTDLMGLLRDRLHTEAPDLPGFGLSPPPADGDYSPAGHARAVISLIEAGPAPVHLLGNSLGGAVATSVAARRPDLVRTLTLVSPALPVRRPRLSNVHMPVLAAPLIGDRLARRLARVPVEQRVQATLRLCWADPAAVPEERVAEAVTEAARRSTLAHEGEAMMASLRSLMIAYLMRGPETLWNLAARVQAPTLLLYGLQDRLVDPRSSRRAVRTFPDARLVLLPRSGHVAQMEHPHVVARAVRDLLEDVSRRTRVS
jgi:pimeloyl-ACP methyl ester carboxylesterase